MTIYHYKIGQHFASAIVNGDYSGLEDSECELLDDFMASLPNHYHHKSKQYKHFDLADYEAEGHFARCEITGLFSDCLDFQLTYI